jgi:SAM-dependent methyltransferase
MLATAMGPNVLWLAESLSQVMDLRPGMRILDMGCGRAASSIFFAREFGVQVWAADLWIKPHENWQRILEAGLQDRVFPISAEAHALPFAHAFFDAAVSLDAYHYFGTDDLYLGYYSRFVRPGGQLGIVVPGLTAELAGGVPPHLQPFWDPDFSTFHSPAWWRAHWEDSARVEVLRADMVPNGWQHWLDWGEFRAERAASANADGAREIELLKADGGRLLGFTRMVARVR